MNWFEIFCFVAVALVLYFLRQQRQAARKPKGRPLQDIANAVAAKGPPSVSSATEAPIANLPVVEEKQHPEPVASSSATVSPSAELAGPFESDSIAEAPIPQQDPGSTLRLRAPQQRTAVSPPPVAAAHSSSSAEEDAAGPAVAREATRPLDPELMALLAASNTLHLRPKLQELEIFDVAQLRSLLDTYNPYPGAEPSTASAQSRNHAAAVQALGATPADINALSSALIHEGDSVTVMKKTSLPVTAAELARSGTTADVLNLGSLSGWLLKKASGVVLGSKWQRRYFHTDERTGCYLCYFETKSDATAFLTSKSKAARGVIDIRQILGVELVSEFSGKDKAASSAEFVISLKARAIQLRADSSREAQTWVYSLLQRRQRLWKLPEPDQPSRMSSAASPVGPSSPSLLSPSRVGSNGSTTSNNSHFSTTSRRGSHSAIASTVQGPEGAEPSFAGSPSAGPVSSEASAAASGGAVSSAAAPLGNPYFARYPKTEEEAKYAKEIAEFRAAIRPTCERPEYQGQQLIAEVALIDRACVRFLLARDLNVEKAAIMFEEALICRVERKLDDILMEPYDYALNFRKLHLACWHGYDKLGRAIYIEQTGLLDISDIVSHFPDAEGRLHYHLHSTEFFRRKILTDASVRAGKRSDQVLSIVDLKGFSMRLVSKVTLDFVREIAALDQLIYPEILGTMLIVNAPVVFSAVWRMIKVFLNKRTADKIKIWSGNPTARLKEMIDENTLPSFLGGKCNCGGREGEWGTGCLTWAHDVQEYRRLCVAGERNCNIVPPVLPNS